MALVVRNLSVLAYANGFTLWHYKVGNEPLTAIDVGGFFNGASDLMASGDLVVVSGDEGARVLAVVDCGKGLVTAALA